MADSLRDQLLKSGIVQQVRDEKRQQQPPPKPQQRTGNKPAHAGGKPAPGGNRPAGGKGQQRPPQRPQQQSRPASNGEIDLAKAYAIRAQTESAERKRVEQEAAEQARLRKERKVKLQQLLEGKALNKPDVDQARHFEYGAKIRRVHVDADQLAAINAGQLGVVQYSGRYLLFDRAIMDQVREIAPEQIALLVEPGESGNDDGVPDDLMW
jgi:uncharacterized protein YaiL (DUF2058 family)